MSIKRKMDESIELVKQGEFRSVLELEEFYAKLGLELKGIYDELCLVKANKSLKIEVKAQTEKVIEKESPYLSQHLPSTPVMKERKNSTRPKMSQFSTIHPVRSNDDFQALHYVKDDSPFVERADKDFDFNFEKEWKLSVAAETKDAHIFVRTHSPNALAVHPHL